MLDKLEQSLQFQQQALGLLNRRQNILASNIANADTPGYQARDIDFAAQLKKTLAKQPPVQHAVHLTMTSGKHIAGRAAVVNNHPLLYRIPDQPSADGNTVDMDRERVSFVDNNIKYQTSLTMLGAQIKGMMSVISQG
ncbi:flagellar basal body rod protein FlgB [Entomohabitans teleogrylli]|uniref:flagellar basal body rod protein FlgB n=1 Tax=Entomohabitans teleogrylli TaxID=1384589 RepID=UPI00073D675E|nr:flagellar basal body rod protein FlgB [Entomohabitans teleogrylli]